MKVLFIMLASSFTTEMSQLFKDYGVPVITLTLLLGLVTGVIRNYDAITDKNEVGSRQQGFLNIIYIMGYFVVALLLITTAATLAKSRLSNLSI